MKKFERRFVWLATTTLVTVMVVNAAQAADMPLKAPVPRVVSDWTGFYIGVHGGYGWARPDISDFDLNWSNPNLPDGVNLHTSRLRGAVLGGHAGYDWQWGQRGVVGLEIDYSAADIKTTQVAPRDQRQCCRQRVDTRALTPKLDSLASARARTGFLVGPEFLLYGTGGAAWGHTKFTDTVTFETENEAQDRVSRASTNHFGWVAGAGAEWKLWGTGMTLRIEYLHYGFGNASLAFDTNVTNRNNGLQSKGVNFNVPLGSLTTDVVRGGVSYKF